MNDPLLAHRSQFPILQRTTYLISNSLGAMPASVHESLAEYARTWASRGVRAWAEGWWTLAGEVGDVIARIIGAGPGEVGMHLNVTSAASAFVSALDFTAGRDGVVVTDMNFPSLLYLYEGQRRSGMRLVRIESEDGVRVDTQRVIDAIDGRTRLVALDHVLFRSAFIQDAKAIAEAAHDRGALVLLDAFQSAGTVPVDVKELGVDAAIGGALKWLCGGPGACWLWVRPDLAQDLRPAITGWMAHPAPFDFDTGPMLFRDDGYRFMNGTPNIPGFMAARPGIEMIAEIGAAAIRAKSMRQTARLVDLARERGFGVTAPENPAERGGTVAVDVPFGKATCQELLSRDVVVDFRPKAGIRISPHFYTEDGELDHCIDQIAEIQRTRAYERHVAGPRYG